MPKILITYYSRSGNTKKMAQSIEQGAIANGCEVILKDVEHTTVEDLLNADSIVIGSPTYYGTMAAEIKKLLDDSVKYHGKLAGKVCGAFTSSGMIGGGNETTIMSILEAFLIHGMIVQGHADIGHFGPVAIGKPDERASKECLKYGQRIADLTLRLSK